MPKKQPRKGRALDRLLRQLERRNKRPWHCTECNVLNTGEHCQNCGRNVYGRPDKEIPAAEDKEPRAGLREDVAEGFTSYEP